MLRVRTRETDMARDKIYGSSFARGALAATLSVSTDGWAWSCMGFDGARGFPCQESAAVDAVKTTGRGMSFKVATL